MSTDLLFKPGRAPMPTDDDPQRPWQKMDTPPPIAHRVEFWIAGRPASEFGPVVEGWRAIIKNRVTHFGWHRGRKAYIAIEPVKWRQLKQGRSR